MLKTTKSVVCSLQNHKHNAVPPEFLITKCAKYLGVTFDNSLSFKLHIDKLTKNCLDQLKYLLS